MLSVLSKELHRVTCCYLLYTTLIKYSVDLSLYSTLQYRYCAAFTLVYCAVHMELCSTYGIPKFIDSRVLFTVLVVCEETKRSPRFDLQIGSSRHVGGGAD